MDEALQPQGYYCDGKTAQRWQVEVKLKPDILLFRVVGETVVHAWPVADIRFEFDPRQRPQVIRSYKDDARVDIADPKYIAILGRTKPHLLKKKYFWNELDAKDTLRWIVCSLVIMFGIYFAWPYLADAIAPIVPERYLSAIGAKEMEFIGKQNRQCMTPEGQQALDHIVTRLAGEQAIKDGLRVGLYNGAEINAYAVPLDHIVVMDGLVQHLTSGDELVAVLAHEIGHLKAKHASRMITRNMGAGLLAQLVGVDKTMMLLDDAYSRDMEREADSLGLAMMQRAQISPAIMVDLFREFQKLEKAQGGSNHFRFFSFLSSHPVTSEREAMAQQAAATYTSPRTAVLTDGEWQSLRTMCDDEKFKKLQRKSSVGDAHAQAGMAVRYLKGNGVQKNANEALQLAKKSAEAEDDYGQLVLGTMYLTGESGVIDDEKSYKLMLASAEQGNAEAAVYLGIMYRYGLGIAVNGIESNHWSQKAKELKAQLNEDEVTREIARAKYDAADALRHKASPDHAQIFQLASQSAEMGNAQAQLLLCAFYSTGDGVAKDPAVAFTWALKAANQNYPDAQKVVSALYQRGLGVERNDAEATRWGQAAQESEKAVLKAAVERAAAQQPVTQVAAHVDDAPLEQPIEPQAVLAWSQASTPKVLSFGYQDYEQKMAAAQTLFSPDGWNGFTKALNDAHFIEALKSNQLSATLTLQGEPQIVSQGLQKSVYFWEVRMPVQVTFAGQNPPQPMKCMLFLRIVRKSNADGKGQIAIQQWITRPL